MSVLLKNKRHLSLQVLFEHNVMKICRSADGDAFSTTFSAAVLVCFFAHRSLFSESRMAVCLAKVLGGITMKQTIKVAAPALKFDDFLKCHFRENTEIVVHDPAEEAKPGDWVLVRQLPQPLSLQVRHQLLRVVYKNGNMIDPITGKKCIGTEFEDEVDQESELFGWKNIHQRHSTPQK